MKLEIKKGEFLDYLSWLFLGLSGEHVLTIVNLDDSNDVALFTWTAIVNDREMMGKILDKIRYMINVKLTLETHTSRGILRRKCSYKDGIVNNDVDEEFEEGVTEIDLMSGWNEA